MDSGPSYTSGSSNTGIYAAQTFGALSSSYSTTLTTWNWGMYLTYAQTGTITTTGISTETMTTSAETTTTSTGTTIASPLGMQPCSIEIGLNGSYTYMMDCGSGSILFYATKPEVIFNDAIENLTSGGSIFVKAGTYTFTTCPVNLVGGPSGQPSGTCAAIGTRTINNIELHGEGNATILALGTNVNGVVLGAYASGWYIHDLQIDGNRADQNAGGASPELIGVMLTGNDENLQHVYEHDAKTFGIWVWGNDEKIVNNWVVNNERERRSGGSGDRLPNSRKHSDRGERCWHKHLGRRFLRHI